MAKRYKRRHPAEVTSARLADHYERWCERFTGEERDEISHIRDALERIVAGRDAEEDGLDG